MFALAYFLIDKCHEFGHWSGPGMDFLDYLLCLLVFLMMKGDCVISLLK